MKLKRTSFLASVLAGALFMAGTPMAPPAIAQDSFANFIIGLRDICAQEPARQCTGRVSAHLDANADKQVSLKEFEAVRNQAKSATKERESGLSPIERNLTSVALLTLKQAKLATVFANFDANDDGGLSEDELFADFQIDQRPFGDIVADPDAVDWRAFAARFGKVGFLIIDLLPPSHRK
ncbi:MAG: hypothetical protein GKS02_05005 [Alphaproteobacteria bacterium]|nr:hypothetical protein [Alphaproteobacteria bacterium]